MDDDPPYFRFCDSLHDEASYPMVKKIWNSEMAGTSNQICILSGEYHFSMEDLTGVKDNINDFKTLKSSYIFKDMNS